MSKVKDFKSLNIIGLKVLLAQFNLYSTNFYCWICLFKKGSNISVLHSLPNCTLFCRFYFQFFIST